MVLAAPLMSPASTSWPIMMNSDRQSNWMIDSVIWTYLFIKDTQDQEWFFPFLHLLHWNELHGRIIWDIYLRIGWVVWHWLSCRSQRWSTLWEGCRLSANQRAGSAILTNQRLGLVSYTPDSVVSFVRISWIINTKDQWRPTDPVSGLC